MYSVSLMLWLAFFLCHSYCLEDERGVMPECEFVFDLELPQDFKPVNADGEVESFQLLPINKVGSCQLLWNKSFMCIKPNYTQIHSFHQLLSCGTHYLKLYQ